MFVARPLFVYSDDEHGGKGQQTYQEQCAGCHGPDGRAQTNMAKKVGATDLTSDTVQQQSNLQLEKMIKDGKGEMPSFDQKLSLDEIRSVLAHIRQMAKKD